MPQLAPYAKMYAALAGAIATALAGIYVDGPFGKALTAVAVVATTIATFSVENKPGARRNEDGSVGLEFIVGVLVGITICLVLPHVTR